MTKKCFYQLKTLNALEPFSRGMGGGRGGEGGEIILLTRMSFLGMCCNKLKSMVSLT